MSTIASSFWRWALAGLAVGVIALALIGLETGSAAAGEGAALASRAKAVDISHFAYHPPKLTVAVGTKVAFTNSSGIAHTATRAGSFDTGHIKPRGSVVVRFTHRGSFAYHCTIHPFMHGKIVVQ
jgi:plastocyanin